MRDGGFGSRLYDVESARWIRVEAGYPAFEASLGRRIAREHLRIMAGNDVVRRTRQAPEGRVALEHLADIVGDGEDAALVDMRIEMGRVGGEHHMAAPGLHPHALQPFRVPADAV